MEFVLFGPVTAQVAGAPVNLGPPRQRAVLAAMLVNAGRVTHTDVLIEQVWGDAHPAGVRHALQVYVSQLRQSLPVPIARRAGGYLLEVDPDAVDLHRFTGLIRAAAGQQGPQRSGSLQRALALWRGVPLADVPGSWADSVRAAWEHKRVDAAVQWARAHGDGPDRDGVIGRLQELLLEYPLVEPLTVALMRALREAGRSAEALERYAVTRARLADDLGADPGPDLQALYLELLDTPCVEAPGRDRPPAQLPADLHGFTGRGAALARLDALLEAGGSRPGLVIAAVSGTAGVGKTTLAVHWAHRVRHRFPDGQLYVNLRGFDPGGRPLDPAVAVRGFLDALGVAAQRIPVEPDAQVALYRTVMAGRRMLVVLDNARDADQVRDLLPGCPGSFVVVTSRSRLADLVALAGAQPIALPLLDRDEARELLAHRVGDDRVAAELITRCAGLPLALAIAGAQAATLGGLTGPLREADGLDAFAQPGSGTDLRAVFSWSYRRLTDPAARLFRLLGLRHSADVSAAAAASLAGLPLPRVGTLLAELAHASLLAEPVPGRYTLHDLLCAYATELAVTVDSDAERHAALHRLLDHYLHSAHRALAPHRDAPPLGPPSAGTAVLDFATEEQALRWLAVECAALVTAVDRAAEQGLDAQAWQLACVLTPYLARQGHYQEWAATQHATLRVAVRTGDRSRQAGAHRALARAYRRLGREADATDHLQRAAALTAH